MARSDTLAPDIEAGERLHMALNQVCTNGVMPDFSDGGALAHYVSTHATRRSLLAIPGLISDRLLVAFSGRGEPRAALAEDDRRAAARRGAAAAHLAAAVTDASDAPRGCGRGRPGIRGGRAGGAG